MSCDVSLASWVPDSVQKIRYRGGSPLKSGSDSAGSGFQVAVLSTNKHRQMHWI